MVKSKKLDWEKEAFRWTNLIKGILNGHGIDYSFDRDIFCFHGTARSPNLSLGFGAEYGSFSEVYPFLLEKIGPEDGGGDYMSLNTKDDLFSKRFYLKGNNLYVPGDLSEFKKDLIDRENNGFHKDFADLIERIDDKYPGNKFLNGKAKEAVKDVMIVFLSDILENDEEIKNYGRNPDFQTKETKKELGELGEKVDGLKKDIYRTNRKISDLSYLISRKK